jgi:hypothetical protein
MTLITKRRLASLASASVMIATVAVAAVPAATFAAAACTETGFSRDGINLTAAQIGGTVTSELDATGCDIGVYNPTGVSGADIHGARYYGVVVNGLTNVDVTNSKVREIGDQTVGLDNPMVGMQRGRAITYINGASGTISGNQISAFQKNGIEVIGLKAAADLSSSVPTSATIQKNIVTGLGSNNKIAQNGIVVRGGGASATVQGNTVSKLWYEDGGVTADSIEACGLLILDARRVTALKNIMDTVEWPIYGAGSKGHVKP